METDLAHLKRITLYHKAPTRIVGDIINNESIRRSYATLRDFLKDNKIQYQESELLELQSCISRAIMHYVEAVAVMQWRYCQLNDYWGPHTKSLMEDSLARILFDIPTERPLYDDEKAILHDKLIDECERIEVRGASLIYHKRHALQKMLLEGVDVLFLGEPRSILDCDFFDDVLRFLGSSMCVVGSATPDFPGFDIIVAGIGERYRIGIWNVVHMVQEFKRTPCATLNLCTFSTDKLTIVRSEVLERDFYTRWRPLIEHSLIAQSLQQEEWLSDIIHSLAHGILSVLSDRFDGSVDSICSYWVDIMCRVHLHHALSKRTLVEGHGPLDSELWVMGLALADFYDLPVLKACLNLTADVLSDDGVSGGGPIRNLIDLATSDPTTSFDCGVGLLSYIRDIFSLQHPASRYTSLLYCSLILRSLRNGQIDWTELCQNIQVDATYLSTFSFPFTYDRPESLMERILNTILIALKRFEEILSSLTYYIEGPKNYLEALVAIPHYFEIHNVEYNSERTYRALFSLPKADGQHMKCLQEFILIEEDLVEGLKHVLLDLPHTLPHHDLIDWLSVQSPVGEFTSLSGVYDSKGVISWLESLSNLVLGQGPKMTD
ncbi:hypothetical protein P9112_000487 [Eukaryota sp. TZLM1-RC]